jgi:hypothetical protein
MGRCGQHLGQQRIGIKRDRRDQLCELLPGEELLLALLRLLLALRRLLALLGRLLALLGRLLALLLVLRRHRQCSA